MTLKEFKKKLKTVPYVFTYPSGATSAALWLTKASALRWVKLTLCDKQIPRVLFTDSACWIGGCASEEVTK